MSSKSWEVQPAENHPLQLVSEICSSGSLLFGVAYLEKMMLRATNLLGFDFGLIARPLLDDPRTVRTDVMVAGGEVQEPLAYALKGTPCENVYDGNLVCVYEDEVDRLFPDDQLLTNMGIVSYVGAPLLAPDRTLLGVLVLMHSKKLGSRDSVQAITEYLAIRAGMELVRESMWADRLAQEKTANREKRLESLGQVVSVVAHDFNNLLAGLMGHAELLQLKLAGDENVQQNITGILQAIHRAEETTKQLLSFSGTVKTSAGVANVHAVLEELQQFCRHSFAANIVVVTDVSSNDCLVAMDASHLHQMLLNLVTNAKDAMPRGGTIKLRVSEDTLIQRGEIGELSGGHYVVLQVEDNGSGIDPDVQDRIFEPFFSTKSKGRGSGLGLASVHRLISAYGGHITLESTPDVGTVFSLFLPVAAESQPSEVALESSMVASCSKRILIAEDDRAIASALREYLELKGFKVLVADNGNQACDFYKQALLAGDHFDLLITDLDMPDCSGIELLARVWALNPNARAIISTGDVGSLETHPLAKPQLCNVIQKPYTFASLIDLVHSTLDTAETEPAS